MKFDPTPFVIIYLLIIIGVPVFIYFIKLLIYFYVFLSRYNGPHHKFNFFKKIKAHQEFRKNDKITMEYLNKASKWALITIISTFAGVTVLIIILLLLDKYNFI
jgi:hypothetical protein